MNGTTNYNRAQSVVLKDKYGFLSEAFFAELTTLLKQYVEYDGLSVEYAKGASGNMIVNISVKKVKPVFLPTV